jgi:adenosylcobinamide-phosphate synthase
MEEQDVARAAVESVLENGNDAIFGAIFWFILFGPEGAVFYRLINTLDAMWGYKNELYIHFGWAAARLDDIVNWLPARITALTYALVGNFLCAIKCWNEQAKGWYSPNAGPVMAAGAGALVVSIGGHATYHGQIKQRPILGMGAAPTASDILRTVELVQRGRNLWILAIFIWAVAEVL